MNEFIITYFNDVSKNIKTQIVYAKDKNKARKKFNSLWIKPYKILMIEEKIKRS